MPIENLKNGLSDNASSSPSMSSRKGILSTIIETSFEHETNEGETGGASNIGGEGDFGGDQ